jgi:pimeloyl-ACP methyl ester carboxylesterase
LPTVEIELGTIHYETQGPEDARPVVFVHGYLMGASLWAGLSKRLSARNLRCIAPTWPLGAHPTAMHRGADMTMPGIAAMVDALIDALNLDDVILVGNDTGGVVTQLVAVNHPTRIGALVLTSCDAYEHFPPGILKLFILAAKSGRVGFRAAMQPMRTAVARGRAYKGVSHGDVDHLAAEWVKPFFRDADIAEDMRQLTKSLHQQTTLDVGARLNEFAKPALVAWSADDVFFPVHDGKRLAAA